MPALRVLPVSLGLLQRHRDKLPVLIQLLVSSALHERWCWSSGLGSSANKGDSCDLRVSGKYFFGFLKLAAFLSGTKKKINLGFWVSESKSSALASML